jgi:hypothetical protein
MTTVDTVDRSQLLGFPIADVHKQCRHLRLRDYGPHQMWYHGVAVRQRRSRWGVVPRARRPYLSVMGRGCAFSQFTPGRSHLDDVHDDK